MERKIKILHLEHSLKDSGLIHSMISKGGIDHDYYLVNNEKDYSDLLKNEVISLVLSDNTLPDYTGDEALKVIKEQYPNIPFLFVSGTMGEDEAIKAMLNGATDYVLKSRLERLVPTIKRAIHEREIESKGLQAEINLREKIELIESQNEKKEKRAAELAVANKELVFQNEEKGKRAAELILADKERNFQTGEKEKRAAELVIANKELFFQNREKEKRADELFFANKELAFQNEEKEKRAAELDIANKELLFQNQEKVKRAEELIIANKELVFQNREKEKRADELFMANKELAFQNEEKEKRAAELVIANKELLYQNREKEKRAIELIKARHKAVESDALKSAFLHNLSHEIRTPMNQILGFASFLKDPELSDSDRDNYIGIIDDQSHQLLHIITNTIEISELATGQSELKLSTFNLGDMMDDLFRSFQPKAEMRKLKLSLNKKIPDEEAVILGDFAKLKQIFGNLIDNAIKFTDTGSIDIGYSRVGKNIVVAVKDTGIGMNEDEKLLIFDRFRQIEITMTRKYGGLGLGLSISSAYISLMSGDIRVESEPGVGSTFFVDFPYTPHDRPSREAKEKPQGQYHSIPSWQDKTILIAEDEESNVQYLKALLSSTGIHLLLVQNGVEAVEQCAAHPEIGVVLMDIKMPRMNGIDATKSIKASRPGLPVIATTAFALSSEREFILSAGFDNYLPKPFSQGDLISMVRSLILSILLPLLFGLNAFGFQADSVVNRNDSVSKSHGKKVYRINYFIEGAIIAVGMTGDLFAIPRLKNKAVLTDEELAFVNTDQQKDLMNTVDRWALDQPTANRTMWKKVSDYGQIGIFLLPSLLVIDKKIRKDWLRLLFMYVEGHTVTFTFYNYSPLGPFFQNRLRPASYYPVLGAETQKESGNRNSFYSGHVASCAYSTFFMVKVYCDYHPEIGAMKYLLYLAASVPPLFMGYARVRSLDHFPSDVAVGFGLGAILGIVIPALHKIPCSKYISLNMSTTPVSVGVGLSWNCKLPEHRIP